MKAADVTVNAILTSKTHGEALVLSKSGSTVRIQVWHPVTGQPVVQIVKASDLNW